MLSAVHLKRAHGTMRWETPSFQILLLGFLQLMSEADHEVRSCVGLWEVELVEMHSSLK